MVYREGMPTNKLWIEHTERAAWDSVEALRERLSKAEARFQALAPNVDRLPELVDALAQLKQKLSLEATAPDELITSALAHIDALRAELDQSRASPPNVVDISVASPRARLDSDLDGDVNEGDDDAMLSDFTRAMTRHQHAEPKLPRDLNRLLSLAEAKLDDLTELDGGALREAALELALVAARIHATSRDLR
jgi:hypothetical protein